MRLALALVALLACAAPAAAQSVPVITDPATQGRIVWDASTTGADRFELSINGSAFVSVGLVTSFKIDPATPNGTYTARLRACRSTAVPQCSGDVSAQYEVRRPDPTPAPPTNFRIEVTIQSGQIALVTLVPLPE